MAQDSTGTAGENCGHPSCLPLNETVAHRIDAGMQLMQAPGPQSSPYRAGLEAKPKQLLPRDHSMLPLSQAGHRGVQSASPRQCSHIGYWRGLGGHAVQHGGRGSARGARLLPIEWRKRYRRGAGGPIATARGAWAG